MILIKKLLEKPKKALDPMICITPQLYKFIHQYHIGVRRFIYDCRNFTSQETRF